MPMRAVGGNWMPGMISQMFKNRMNRNSVPEERREAAGVVADDVLGDAVVDELVGHLHDVLHAAGLQRLLAAAEDEDRADRERRDEDEQHRLVDRKR